MRIAICGIHIESSTFSAHLSTAADFEVTRGGQLLARYPFLVAGQPLASRAEWVPILHARALPGGPVAAGDYQAWKDEIVAGLRASLPLDGVFLDMHGAMSVMGMDDAEADLAAAIRAVIGPDALISTAMDLHGNVSEELFGLCDMLTCYRTAPHIDVWETRERAAQHLVDALSSGERVHRALVHVPILLPGEMTSTRVEPAASLYARTPELTARDGVWDASIYIGFAWADEPRCKAAIVACGTDAGAVEAAAAELAKAMWGARHDFVFVGPTATLEDAVTAAIESDARPYFISDSGDNPGAGGADDTTAVLAEFLSRPEICSGRVTALVASILDPATVARATEAGVGATTEFEVGGRLDTREPGPVDVLAEVLQLGEDALGGGTALLRTGGLDVIVTERRTQYASASMYEAAGAPLGSHDIVAVKMGYLEPDLYQAQRAWVIALTPGGVDQDLRRLGHRSIDRPMIPFDEDAPAPERVVTGCSPASTAG